VEPETGQAMIGYSLLPQWRGRGYASRAAALLAEWAFTTANLGRLVAGTAPTNAASQRVLQRIGFVQEGRLRGRIPRPDRGRDDDLLYGLLRTDLRSDIAPVQLSHPAEPSPPLRR
jgi:RimJ/RimL family protein N-acetyltransferase